jgi:hypothetical protein
MKLTRPALWLNSQQSTRLKAVLRGSGRLYRLREPRTLFLATFQLRRAVAGAVGRSKLGTASTSARVYSVRGWANSAPLSSCSTMLPMAKKAWAEDVAYAGATIPHMMAMFGWKDEKMPSIYIAKADRERLGFDGMNKLIAFDQMQNIGDLTMPEDENRIVTFESSRRKKS